NKCRESTISLVLLEHKLRLLPRFLDTGWRRCNIAATKSFLRNLPAAMAKDTEQSRQKSQPRNQTGPDANRHDQAQTLDALMLAQHQTAETSQRRQSRDQHGFASALA